MLHRQHLKSPTPPGRQSFVGEVEISDISFLHSDRKIKRFEDVDATVQAAVNQPTGITARASLINVENAKQLAATLCTNWIIAINQMLP